jgi:RNA-directed DNA polymerase
MSRVVPMLIAATGLSESDIRKIISNAPIRYKTYPIPKRRGGYRKISQPAREVKALQRALVAGILEHLPIHPSATAYRPNLSIKDNAIAHAGDGPILKFDFEEFFPSIRARDWEAYCRVNSLFQDPEDIYLTTQIFFYRNKKSKILRLAIGAPSSPCLSNVLMNSFDSRISEMVASDHVTYTRYADDLTFSARRTGYLNGVEKVLRKVLSEIKSPHLKINNSKTVLVTKKYRRVVTGLILANDGSVSLGHDRKKIIRAAVHHAMCGKLDKAQCAHLAGLLAFVQDVEPEFLNRLTAKYGYAVIAAIRKSALSLA